MSFLDYRGEIMDYNANDRSAAISQLQSYLRRIENEKNGLPLVATDGIFDQRTRTAVMDAQRRNGLPMTGTVDLDTWNAIYREYLHLEEEILGIFPFLDTPGEYEITEETVGDLVIILKLMLREVTIDFDFDTIDSIGIYDEATANAVRKIQRIHRLPETGRTDVKTWNYIARAYNDIKRRYNG